MKLMYQDMKLMYHVLVHKFHVLVQRCRYSFLTKQTPPYNKQV